MTTPAREIIKSFFYVPAGGPGGSDPFADALARFRAAAKGSADPALEVLGDAGTKGDTVERAFEALDSLVNSFPVDARMRVLWDVAHAAALSAERVAAEGDEAARLACSRLLAVAYRQYVPAALRCDECALHWNAFLERRFPAAPADLFVRTVDLHNAVNRALGKAEVTAEEARGLCSWAL